MFDPADNGDADVAFGGADGGCHCGDVRRQTGATRDVYEQRAVSSIDQSVRLCASWVNDVDFNRTRHCEPIATFPFSEAR